MARQCGERVTCTNGWRWGKQTERGGRSWTRCRGNTRQLQVGPSGVRQWAQRMTVDDIALTTTTNGFGGSGNAPPQEVHAPKVRWKETGSTPLYQYESPWQRGPETGQLHEVECSSWDDPALVR